jgi:cobalt-zinc-cadmium efflux system outer membrane protein
VDVPQAARSFGNASGMSQRSHPAHMATAALGGLVAILLAGTWPAHAQQASKLTLQAALDLADKQNLDLAAARRRRAVALAGIHIAGQRPNPSLTFEALRDSPHEAFLFDQPLELGFKRQRRIEVAREESEVTEVEIAALARQVRRSTREAFYRAILARAESARLGRVVQLAQRLERIAQERFEAGDVAQLEVIQAALEVARAQADAQVAQQREKVSLSQLNALLNEPASTTWELAGDLADAHLAVSLPELIQRADESNPALQRLGQERKVEQRRRELLKAERIPNLSLQFGTDLNSLPDFRAGPRGQLSLELPLFMRNQGQIAQSLANQQVLEAERVATERAVAARVEASYFDLEAQQTQVVLYKGKLLPAAQQVEGLAEESYRAGKTSILVVLEAQRNVQEVERNYLESLFTLQSLFASLEETVGGRIE